MSKKNVLILCTGNSCRSQMAEGLINTCLGDHFRAFSAGTKPSGRVHPLAITVMAELRIDLSQHQSQSTADFRGQYFDYVITVCDAANEDCPAWLNQAGARAHIGFVDPAEATGSTEAVLAVFRQVRDQIKEQLLDYLRRQ